MRMRFRRRFANPYAMIMSGKMLFDWLGRKRNEARATAAGKLIDRAMDKVIAEAKHLTADLGGEAGTTEMGDATASAVGWQLIHEENYTDETTVRTRSLNPRSSILNP